MSKSGRVSFKIIIWSMVVSLFGVYISMDMLRVKNTYARQLGLPAPTQMVNLSEEYSMPMLKGIQLDLENPLNIQFIVDTGSKKDISSKDAQRLVDYFLAALTTPSEDLWVNLSPYEKDRIVPANLGQTEMGKDLLAQDYILKQLYSSLTHPDTPRGKTYWEGNRGKGIGDSLGKIWIKPGEIQIQEQNGLALITKATFDVETEDGVDSLLTPEVLEDINHGKNFTKLRQVYHSLILGLWFKKKYQQSFWSEYVNQNKINGIEIEDKETKNKIWSLYCEAFKKGVYNIVRKDEEISQRRNYFCGGVEISSAIDIMQISKAILTPEMVDSAFIGNQKIVGVVSSPVEEKTISSALDKTAPRFKGLHRGYSFKSNDGRKYTIETLYDLINEKTEVVIAAKQAVKKRKVYVRKRIEEFSAYPKLVFNSEMLEKLKEEDQELNKIWEIINIIPRAVYRGILTEKDLQFAIDIFVEALEIDFNDVGQGQIAWPVETHKLLTDHPLFAKRLKRRKLEAAKDFPAIRDDGVHKYRVLEDEFLSLSEVEQRWHSRSTAKFVKLSDDLAARIANGQDGKIKALNKRLLLIPEYILRGINSPEEVDEAIELFLKAAEIKDGKQLESLMGDHILFRQRLEKQKKEKISSALETDFPKLKEGKKISAYKMFGEGDKAKTVYLEEVQKSWENSIYADDIFAAEDDLDYKARTTKHLEEQDAAQKDLDVLLMVPELILRGCQFSYDIETVVSIFGKVFQREGVEGIVELVKNYNDLRVEVFELQNDAEYVKTLLKRNRIFNTYFTQTDLIAESNQKVVEAIPEFILSYARNIDEINRAIEILANSVKFRKSLAGVRRCMRETRSFKQALTEGFVIINQDQLDMFKELSLIGTDILYSPSGKNEEMKYILGMVLRKALVDATDYTEVKKATEHIVKILKQPDSLENLIKIKDDKEYFIRLFVNAISSALTLARKNILLVEDDPDLIEAFTSYLKYDGATEVIVVKTAADALAVLNSRYRPKFDLMITDNNLGVGRMLGHQLIGEVRKNKKHDDMPIVFQSTIDFESEEDTLDNLDDELNDLVKDYPNVLALAKNRFFLHKDSVRLKMFGDVDKYLDAVKMVFSTSSSSVVGGIDLAEIDVNVDASSAMFKVNPFAGKIVDGLVANITFIKDINTKEILEMAV